MSSCSEEPVLTQIPFCLFWATSLFRASQAEQHESACLSSNAGPATPGQVRRGHTVQRPARAAAAATMGVIFVTLLACRISPGKERQAQGTEGSRALEMTVPWAALHLPLPLNTGQGAELSSSAEGGQGSQEGRQVTGEPASGGAEWWLQTLKQEKTSGVLFQPPKGEPSTVVHSLSNRCNYSLY